MKTLLYDMAINSSVLNGILTQIRRPFVHNDICALHAIVVPLRAMLGGPRGHGMVALLWLEDHMLTRLHIAALRPPTSTASSTLLPSTPDPQRRLEVILTVQGVCDRRIWLHCLLTVVQDIKAVHQDKQLITPSEVYTTLMKISDSDLHLLGHSDEYAHPEWMILTVLPVPLPPVQPSISVDGGTMRSEDDLTYKLGEVIKAPTNVRKSEQEGSPTHIVTEYEQLLQVCAIEYAFCWLLFLNIA